MRGATSKELVTQLFKCISSFNNTTSKDTAIEYTSKKVTCTMYFVLFSKLQPVCIIKSLFNFIASKDTAIE